uniref:MI domain-containing protein n=1 Tax=Brassica oleracea var. oleracea TaxID=109376 RepID=A0A0D3BGB9_BRAOL
MASSDGFLTNGQLNKHELATENSPPLFADLDIKSPNRREWCCKHIQEAYPHISSPVFDPFDDYKRSIVSIINEYFSSGDVAVAASDLREIGLSEYHPQTCFQGHGQEP